MRENYNSFDFWQNYIDKHKTLRGHMFMDKPLCENTIYFHTLVFTENNGLNNMWGYLPNVRSLLGYIQYSFLQEAFYKWIYGDDKVITKIPNLSVDKIIKDAEKKNEISKDVAESMKEDYKFVRDLWYMPFDKVNLELRKFMRAFNKKWVGDSKKFMYLRAFKTPAEVGEFIVSSFLCTGAEDELEEKLGLSIDELRNVCNLALKDDYSAQMFKDILQKKLSDVF